MIKEAAARGMQARDVPETFICKAMVNMVRSESIMYKACPSENCNKKVSLIIFLYYNYFSIFFNMFI